jgi:SAM-dependent methyltransferase
MTVEQREKAFFNDKWKEVQLRPIAGSLAIPGLDSFVGKRVLICSCGSGIEPVRAAKQGAETYAFDISETAAFNARRMAAFNGVTIQAAVMDFHQMAFPPDFFDVLYGSSVLHHVDCERAAREMYRVLKPGGVAYFRENSDRNPLLRVVRRWLFGAPGAYQKTRAVFLVKRTGSTDEYPLTDDEIDAMRNIFHGNLQVLNDRFLFFFLLDFLVFKNRFAGRAMRALDDWIGRTFPSLLKYSFSLQVLLRKPQSPQAASTRPLPTGAA